MSLPRPPLLVITDRRQATRPLEEVAERIFAAGCRWLSLREKDLDPAERLDLLRRLVAIGRRHGALVSVHGDAEACLAADAGGLHLPAGGAVRAARRRIGPHRLLGLSTHALAEIADARGAGIDYVTLSPIFASAGKPGYGPALGVAALAAAARIGVPVLALGGITPGNAGDCLAAGAGGVAVMGLLMRAPDPGAEAARLVAALDPHPDPRTGSAAGSPPLRGGGR